MAESNIPLSLNAYVENEKKESLIKYSSRDVLASQLYSEDMLEERHWIYTLAPGEQISAYIYLQVIPIFNTETGKLPKGNYKVQISYFANASNSVGFTIL